MTLFTVPQSFDQLEVRSRAIFHWRARDGSVVALTGHPVTYERAGTAETSGSNGGTITWPSHVPPLAVTTEEVGVRTGEGEVWRYAFHAPPRECTLRVRFVERGTPASGEIVRIGAADASTPYLVLRRSAGSGYEIAHHNGSALRSATLAVLPSTGDAVRITARLLADGSVSIAQSIDEGAETTESSAASSLPSQWSDAVLHVGGRDGSDPSSAEIRTVLLVPGLPDEADLEGRL